MCPSSLHSTADIATFIACLVDQYLLPLLMLVAVTAFIYHVAVFIGNSADTTKQAEAKNYILWSLAALAVIVSIWGIVNLGLSSFGIDSVIPQFPTK